MPLPLPCAACRYDLTGLEPDAGGLVTCPECGEVQVPGQIEALEGRRTTRFIVAMLLPWFLPVVTFFVRLPAPWGFLILSVSALALSGAGCMGVLITNPKPRLTPRNRIVFLSAWILTHTTIVVATVGLWLLIRYRH